MTNLYRPEKLNVLSKIKKTEYEFDPRANTTKCILTTFNGFTITSRLVFAPTPDAKDSKELAFEDAVGQLAVLEAYRKNEELTTKHRLALFDAAQCMHLIIRYQDEKPPGRGTGTTNWAADLGSFLMHEVSKINPHLSPEYVRLKGGDVRPFPTSKKDG